MGFTAFAVQVWALPGWLVLQQSPGLRSRRARGGASRGGCQGARRGLVERVFVWFLCRCCVVCVWFLYAFGMFLVWFWYVFGMFLV